MARKQQARGVVKSKKDATAKSGKEEGKFSLQAVKAFIAEVKVEFHKVVWPDKKATLGLTGFVLVLVAMMSIYLGSVDFILGKVVTSVLR